MTREGRRRSKKFFAKYIENRKNKHHNRDAAVKYAKKNFAGEKTPFT
jgi:hypothetical protein